jgi:hypothetical protein
MKATPQFPKTLCILLGAVGLAAYVFVGWVDYVYGETTAFSAEGKAAQPIIMVIVSIAGFCCVSGAGAAARVSRYFTAGLLILLSVGCMAYSGLNGIGFFAGETMSLTRQAEAKNKAAKDATDKANDESIKLRRDALTWMTGTQIKTTKERERVEDKVIDLATRPVEIKTADVQASVVDARSVAMKKLFGMEVENAQITNSAWLVAILLGIKLVFPTLAFALWPAAKVGASLQDDFATFPEGNAQNWTLSPKQLSKQDSLLDLRRIFPSRTHHLTLPYLTARWGLTPEGTRQRLRDWEARKLITLDKTKTDRGYALYVKGISPVLVANNSDMKESA